MSSGVCVRAIGCARNEKKTCTHINLRKYETRERERDRARAKKKSNNIDDKRIKKKNSEK